MEYIITLVYRLNKILRYKLCRKYKKQFTSDSVYSFNFNEKYFHLGDELFFYPSIIWLKKNNYNIHISGSKLKLFSENLTARENLWLIRPDMYYHNQPNFNVWKGKGCISQDIMKNILKLMNKKFTESQYHECKNELARMLIEHSKNSSNKLLNNVDQYNIISSELESGYWRHSKSYIEKTKNIFSNIDRNYPTIIVGTDPSSYIPKNFIIKETDIDLRGKTSINQLIGLLMNKQVKYIYTYDTFIYHLCCLLDKKNECFVRGQINIKKINKRFIPAF